MTTRSESRLSLLPLLMTFAIGVGAATQIAMIGALARQRGIPEATWISLLATITGVAFVLGVRALRGDMPVLPAPLDRAPPFVLVSAGAGMLLVLSLRGLEPYYAMTGVFAVAFLLGTAALVPRMGVGLFFIVNAGGTLLGSALFDHFGAFGASANHFTPMRALGFFVVFAGIAVVRFAR